MSAAVQPNYCSIDDERVPLTVVIPTLNEADQIEDTLADLAWVDEVIVVDGGSVDGTAEIAAAAGAVVIALPGVTIGAQRNAGIAAAHNRWILALDADERVSPSLRYEVSVIVTGGRFTASDAYRMQFRNHYLGRELRHGPWGRDWHVRLFTNDRRFQTQRVHESLEPLAPLDDIGTLSGPIMHRPYRDIGHHVTKILKYARWGAEDMRARGRTAGVWELTARPAWRFVRDYFVLSGWRDGLVGLIVAALSAFASFLKYAFLFSKSRDEK